MVESPEDNKQGSQQETIRYVDLYASEGKIYTRKISGFYQKIRRYTGIPLLLGFLLLPWLIIDGRPAVLFDLPARQFHILWMTFWPQDFMYLAWVLIIAAFALFTVTVLFGRVWCGFTCPQTVWTLMFIAVEHVCEGDRNQRMKLDRQPWGVNKVLRKSSKHLLWVLIAFITGVTFIGYFTPIRELLWGLLPQRDDSGMLYLQAHPAAVFWTLFFTGMTYLNAGWLREQVCKYMCPYARFQSVMYDTDTLAVHYDRKRGEPRGPRKLKEDYKAAGMGDCIDCSWCVQVCPVDIDIRDGLQYECINCGLCVDACNAVMDKMHYPRGLIRFASERELDSGVKRFARPRLFGYGAAVVIMVGVLSYAMTVRTPVSVDVQRDRGVRLYRVSGEFIQNVYTIKINNMDNENHVFDISAVGEQSFTVENYRPTEIPAGEMLTLPLRVTVNREELLHAQYDILITVTAQGRPELTARAATTFMGPGRNYD